MNGNIRDLLSAYSEEIRLRIAFLLDGSSICVNCLVAVFDMPQSTISRHLAILRNAGLISAEKKGSNTYYSLETTQEPFGKLNRKMIRLYKKELGDREPFVKDRENLQKQLIACPVDCHVA